MLSGDVIWRCYLVMLSGDVIWLCYLVMLSGDVIWCQEAEGDTGVVVWDAAIVLSKYLETRQQGLKGRSALGNLLKLSIVHSLLYWAVENSAA